MNFKIGKKGFTDNLQQVMLGLFGVIALFIVMGIFLAQGGKIVGDTRDQYASTTVQYKVANNSLAGMENFASNLPSVGNVIGVALIITVLLGALVFAIVRR